MIPLVDLHAQYLGIKNEIDKAVQDCISQSHFIKGEAVSRFENAFAEYVGSKHCVGCGNGTDALEIILKSLGIGPGDEVIVPALSWISTAESVNNVGAEPVFADVKLNTYTIDPEKLEKLISRRTKAIIPVHLYGLPAEMDEIMSFSAKHKLFVVEDCAQAHGAVYKGKKIGTFGIASAFSFFPTKNLGAYGDAGAIITDDIDISQKARKIANHGQLLTKHIHDLTGRNSRLDTIQAAVLEVKLKHLDKWNGDRIRLAKQYMLRLKELDNYSLPFIPSERTHVFHLFAVRLERREDLISVFNKNGIGWSVHYPTPLPHLGAYKYKNHNYGDFPVAEKICKEIISLPLFPELTEDQLNIICDTIIENN
ncbi:MAG: DegT/DnrJ/EryC1/StrS family aminotransferase [Bacteroidales bacterium]|jgi:dTDP-4-amino-4,6-dideoxygalactose transaminase|nr:DegT/DnrJ/EryC1/StrS family aminotransferase [Bacteroidales bacterium]